MSKSRDLAKVINSDGGLTLRGNTLFESDNAFDIGSSEFKIRDLYVSQNSFWVGDEHKLSIDSTTGKFKARKRKKGKIPKKLRDRLVGSGKMFDTEALMLADFKSKYFTGVSNQEDKNNPDHADFNPNTKKWVRFLNDLEIKKDDGSNEDYETPEDVMDDDEDFDEDRDDDKVESTQTATSSTLGLVKIGYTKSGYNYPVELSGDKMYVNVPWVDTQVTVTNAYTSTSTSSALSANKGKELKDLVDGKAASSHSHSGYASSSHSHSGYASSSQTATSSTLGLVKIGYTENGKYYPVELSSGKMYVNVPWTDTDTDTNTTYSTATSSTLGLVKTGYTENGKYYPVELSSSKMYVNVPWTDTNTTYSTATSSTLGLVKTGYTENGKYYPVELSSGKMYVNVPWTDTDTNTHVNINNTLTSTSTSEALSANQGKTLKGLVDGKAASSHSHSGYASSSHTHTQGDYDVGDNVKLKLGASDDLQMYHDGSNSYINSWNGGFGAGALILIGGESSNDYSSAGISLRPTSSATKRGYVEIYPDGDGSWFDQGGMLVFEGGQDSDAAGTVYHPDAKIYLGDTNAGQTAGAEDLVIETGGTSFNAGSIILRTNGVDVSVNNGAITATSFTGDGSALTNLPSSGGSGGVSTGKAIAMAIVFG